LLLAGESVGAETVIVALVILRIHMAEFVIFGIGSSCASNTRASLSTDRRLLHMVRSESTLD
jgi:hypothetical protein